MCFFNWFPTPKFLTLATDDCVMTDKGVKFKKGKSATFANGILPDDKTYLFTTLIDKIAREGMNDAVAFIIEENVPLKLAESVFSYEIIGTEGDKIKVAVTAAPKSFVNSQIALFKQAGVTIVSFDIESQVLAREAIPYGDNKVHIIINLSSRKTGLYIAENRVIEFSTTMHSPLELNEEADVVRRANEIKAKMEEVISFWNKKIEKIILCGIGLEKADFSNAIVGQSSIESAQINSWIN